MKRTITFSLSLFLIVGCGKSEQPLKLESSQAPEKLTLYSIDGNDPDAYPLKKEGAFRGYPVLGKVEITDPEQRKALLAKLKDAYARRPDYGVKCFYPRHGLRVVTNGKTVDYVICFQCEWFREYTDSSIPESPFVNLKPLAKDVKPDFDKPLKDAGVPLAPSRLGENGSSP